MKASGITYVRKRAASAYGHSRENCKALGYISRYPQSLIRNPQWLRQRTAATMALRQPWWPYDAVSWMTTRLPSRARVFEYGGGGSTLWLEDRGAIVTAVEHDGEWYKQLAGQVASETELLYVPPEATGVITSASAPGFFDTYAAAIDDRPDGSLDLVIVDGRARIECARRAMPKVRPGGLLLLDDTDRHRYQPALEMLGIWEPHVFSGLKPGQRSPAQTSVWRRPAGG